MATASAVLIGIAYPVMLRPLPEPPMVMPITLPFRSTSGPPSTDSVSDCSVDAISPLRVLLVLATSTVTFMAVRVPASMVTLVVVPVVPTAVS